MKSKMTALERNWVLYDVGNSAFTMMVSTIIPLWFNTLAKDGGLSDSQYLAYWSYATSIATILVAFIGPIGGTIADNKGFKKPIFTTALLIGVICCALLGLVHVWLAYLIIYILAKTAFSASLVFYDGMINDITSAERVDEISSKGYAWGYLGSCIPFTAALAIYLLGTMNKLPMKLAIAIDFILVAVWWLLTTVPLLKSYKQKYYVEHQGGQAIKSAFVRLGTTLKNMYKKEKKVFLFLLAFFFYIDGVYTIIDEAVAIGTALGLDQVGLLVILLLTQVVAFVFATVFGKLSEKYDSVFLISVCIFGYMFVAIFALFLDSLVKFGIMAFVVGMFQGAIQALSRSYYAKIIPAESSGEYFGLFDICGKGAAFMGTTLMGITTQITNSVNIGVATMAILFTVGLLLLRKSQKV